MPTAVAAARVEVPLLTAAVVCRIDAERDAAVVIGAVLALAGLVVGGVILRRKRATSKGDRGRKR